MSSIISPAPDIIKRFARSISERGTWQLAIGHHDNRNDDGKKTALRSIHTVRYTSSGFRRSPIAVANCQLPTASCQS